MSRKHNTQHPDRAGSHYIERLQARGLSKAPRMESLDTLRARQERRVELGLAPWKLMREEAEAAKQDVRGSGGVD